jgi:hypothetical protein
MWLGFTSILKESCTSHQTLALWVMLVQSTW